MLAGKKSVEILPNQSLQNCNKNEPTVATVQFSYSNTVPWKTKKPVIFSGTIFKNLHMGEFNSLIKEGLLKFI